MVRFGYDVNIFDLQNQQTESLPKFGATYWDSLDQMLTNCDYIFLMVDGKKQLDYLTAEHQFL